MKGFIQTSIAGLLFLGNSISFATETTDLTNDIAWNCADILGTPYCFDEESWRLYRQGELGARFYIDETLPPESVLPGFLGACQLEATQQSIQVNRRLEPQDADGDGINDSGKLSIVIEADPQRAIQDAMWCMRNRYEECVDANTQATDGNAPNSQQTINYLGVWECMGVKPDTFSDDTIVLPPPYEGKKWSL